MNPTELPKLIIRKAGIQHIPAVLICFILFGSCTTSPELTWHSEEGYRWAPVRPGGLDQVGFRRVAPNRSGVEFTNRLSDSLITTNQNLLNGSGVATADVDGDGLVDIYLTGLESPNRLYRNLGGFRFEDITDAAGVVMEGRSSSGVLFADVDGDHDPDLLVTSLEHPTQLFLNDGTGRFIKSETPGLGDHLGNSTMALADTDGDGDLDLYITRYKLRSAKDIFDPSELIITNMTEMVDGTLRLVSPYDDHFILIQGDSGPDIRELGTADAFYLNNGDGTFSRVERTDSLFLDTNGEPFGLQHDWGLTAKFHDVNGDGRPDLYVCNDFWTPDRLWINRGDGTFQLADPLAFRSMSFSSMAVDFSDINRDGISDFFVTEMLSESHDHRARQMTSTDPFGSGSNLIGFQPQYMRNSLYLGRPDNSFAEISYLSGTEATGWSWATRFLDIDLDGYEDLIINTGHAYDVLDLDTQQRLSRQAAGRGYILNYPPLPLTNVILKNNRDLTFSDRSAEWGFEEEDISHGLATADFDNDGDLDIIISRLNGPVAIFENRSNAPRIAVRLRGFGNNTAAVGSKIRLTGGDFTQSKEVSAGGDYLSGSDPLTVFAADPDVEHTIHVTWPNGIETTIDRVSANRIYEIDAPAEALTEGRLSPSPSGMVAVDSIVVPDGTIYQEPDSPGWFEERSDLISFSHHENIEAEPVQPLLPIGLDNMGPGVAWLDLDDDGDDDLIIGTGKGGRIAIFENDGNGGFSASGLSDGFSPAQEDVTSIIGWREKSGVQLLTAISPVRNNSAGDVSVQHYRPTTAGNPAIYQTIGATPSSTTSLAAADYNGDGFLDLFAGGRFIPGEYPREAGSRLFLGGPDGFHPDDNNTGRLANTGLVTGALFTDIDLDGDPDLLISTEWGPVRLFRNDGGEFREMTSQTGLDRYLGIWNGIATGDFNNDGLPDFIATNIGRNSVYQLRDGEALKLYYSDFNGDSVLEILDAFYNPEIGNYVPRRDLHELYSAIPSIVSNVSSYRDFAGASLGQILGLPLNSLPSKEINTVEHAVFLNQGSTFTMSALPVEAQFSAAYYAGVADFDNDGNEDLYLGQNQFSLPLSVPRLDTGRGILLAGDGTGKFQALESGISGIRVYGEQRGGALGDFNRDGKTDLAISQNGAPARIYMNRTEKNGLRIRLHGPPENLDGIGSGLRLVYPDGEKGPRREIQAGSGYLSQNSTTQIMGFQNQPEAIEITWFDGTVRRVDVASGKTEYDITY